MPYINRKARLEHSLVIELKAGIKPSCHAKNMKCRVVQKTTLWILTCCGGSIKANALSRNGEIGRAHV